VVDKELWTLLALVRWQVSLLANNARITGKLITRRLMTCKDYKSLEASD